MKILKKRNVIFILVFTLAIGLISFKYVIEANKPKSDKQNLIESSKFNSQIKDYTTQDEINKNIKIKLKEPGYMYKNMKKVKVEGRNENNMTNSFDVLVSWYKADDGQEIRIQQTVDTGKPQDLLAKCKKISFDGTDAWVYGNPAGDNFIQFMFWKDGMYYNVSGSIGEDELVKVLKSLK